MGLAGTLTFFLRMLLLLFVAAVYAITPEEQFQDFISTYGKRYADEKEFTKRFGIFRDNLLRIEKQNAEHIKVYNGEAVFGVTKFSDLTPAEFKNIYLKAKPNNIPDEERVVPDFKGPLADSIDWCAKGLCTAIKDQGDCGSGWAFSAVSAMESYAVLSGIYNLTELSVQQVNSCDMVDTGCDGGDTKSAYNYIVKNRGVTSQRNYPYFSGISGYTEKCKLRQSQQIVANMNGFKSITLGEDNLKVAVNAGPVSICVAAQDWNNYKGGVLKACSGEVDHCAQVVGYSTSTDDGDYWIVRNSWGHSWGEGGLIRIQMGNDLCKISDEITYPTF